MNARLMLLTIGFVAAVTATPIGDRAEARSAAIEQRPDPVTMTVRGTVELNGCQVAPRQVQIAADLLIGGRVGGTGRNSLPAVQSPERAAANLPPRALVSRGRDSHTFDFRFANLEPGRLYRLSVGVPPNPCGRVFWRGPMDGLVVAGGSRVLIEGFAARTRLEIKSLPQRTSSRIDPATWVGADDLQFTDPARSVRTLRWRSDLPGVTRGELQVAAAAFPTREALDPCDEPDEGVIWRQQVAFRGAGWTTLPPIDFARVLASRRSDGPADEARQRILNGLPLHVRVVPYRDNSPLCDPREAGVHGEVLVAKLPSGGASPSQPPTTTPILTAADNTYLPPYFLSGEDRGHPTYSELAYRVIKAHKVPPVPCYSTIVGIAYAKADPIGCVFIHLGWASPGQTIEPTIWFYFIPNSGGGCNVLSCFTDSVGSVATGLYKAAGMAVNLLSDGVEAVKNAVAELSVKLLTAAPGMGTVCDTLGDAGVTCASLVKTGIEIGLTSMGMPPSIPNWDQLQAQGIDYVSAQVAQQVAGNSALAQEVTKAMIKQVTTLAVEAMTANRNKAGGPEYDWLLPYLGFNPASWTASVTWTGSAPLPTEALFIKRNATSLFAGGEVPLPTVSLPDIYQMHIPMVLAPNLSKILNPLCRSVWAGSTTCEPNPFLSKPVCEQQMSVTYNWITVPCNQRTLDIYYRDQWTKKMDATKCNVLAAVSRHWLTNQPGGLAISVLAPTPPFLDFGLVNVPNFTTWNGPVYNAPGCP